MGPPAKTLWERLNNSFLVRFLLLFAAGWALAQVLVYFEHVIVVFAFASILAFLLNYPVRWLQRFIPHSAAVTVIFLLSLVIFGGLTFTVGIAILSQAQQLIDSITEFFNSLAPTVEGVEQFLRNRNLRVDLQLIEEEIRNQILAGIGTGIGSSLVALQILLTNLIDLILISVVAFFMLLDGKRLWRLFLNLFPDHFRERLTTAIERNFLGFFWGRFLLSLFFAASTFITLLVLEAPFALILAAIAGVFDLIPGIGATLGISLVALILLPQSVWLAIKVLVGCIILQQVEENLLLPRIMQGSLNINPVVMFFALLVGIRVAGLLGIFLAIPIAGVIVSLLETDEIKGDGSEEVSNPE